MRHHRTRRRLQRNFSHRKALLENLVRNLLQYQRIRTTHVKAKEAQRLADRLITLGKTGTVHSRRQAFAILGDRDMIKKLFDEVAPLFKNRNGGYTRVLHMDLRKGDAAPMALLELVEKAPEVTKEIKEPKEKKAKAAPEAGTAPEEAPVVEKHPPKEPKAKSASKEEKQKQDEKDKSSFVSNLKKFFKRKDRG